MVDVWMSLEISALKGGIQNALIISLFGLVRYTKYAWSVIRWTVSRGILHATGKR